LEASILIIGISLGKIDSIDFVKAYAHYDSDNGENFP